MNRPADPGGTYSSINPEGLNTVVSQLQKTVDGIDGLSGYQDRFATGGVSTTHLSKLGTFKPTISDLIPELTRRVSLARAMVAEDGGKLAYFSSDSLGPFKTVGDAQAQAAKDAKAIDDGDGLTDDALANLQKYGTDPDYAAALLKTLGPKTTYKLLYNNNTDPSDDRTTAITNWLTTATVTVPIDAKFLTEGAKAYDRTPSLALLSPYLKEGVWPDDQLGRFADMYFQPEKFPDLGPPGLDDSTLTNLLSALSNNPGGGSKYFAAHQDLVYGAMRTTMSSSDDLSKAWAGYMHAATIEARNSYGTDYLGKPGTNPAILNAEYLMKKVGSEDGEWPDELHDTFAAMASSYLHDYTRGLSSPIDVGSVKDPRYDGVSVSVADWQKFLAQGMYTNGGAATLMAAFEQQIEQSREGASNADQGTGSDSAYWSHYTTGALQKTFNVLYQNEHDRRGDKADDMESGIEGYLDQGIDFTLDPAGTLKSIGVDAAKSLLHQAVSVDPDDLPDLPGQFDTKGNYAYYAADYLHDQGGKFPPVKEKVGGGTTITWTGDPTLYTQPSPPCGDFTDPKFQNDSGRIDLDKLRSDPDAWRSYDDWLHDPAVQHQVSPGFSKDFDGELEGH